MRKVAWVKWRDACCDDESDTFDSKDLLRSIECESAGIVIRDDENGIVLGQQTYTGTRSKKDIVRGHISIPKAYIVKKKIFKE
jgi:hypothetical protein